MDFLSLNEFTLTYNEIAENIPYIIYYRLNRKYIYKIDERYLYS